MINSVITGSGHYLPNRIVTNEDFVNHEFYDESGNRLDKTGEEITRKFEEITEIRERRYVEDDLLNSDIATFAAKKAIEESGVNPEELDYIIVGHNFGDIDPVGHQIDIMPSISAKVKHNLGIKNLKCKPYDMTFGCPGWIESLILGHQFIQANIAKKVLVIGASTGFMAANMRKAAKAQGLDVSIHAVSKSQVPEYADKIDVLLLGPHFSAEVPKYKEMLKDHNVKVTSIDPDDYAALDGESILESALEFYEEG